MLRRHALSWAKMVVRCTKEDLLRPTGCICWNGSWTGEGAAGPKQLMAFMVCHNIDRFRQYSGPQNLGRFRLEKSRVRKIEKDDKALLKFGFDRMKFILDDQPTIRV
jgi:hypothetical protein